MIARLILVLSVSYATSPDDICLCVIVVVVLLISFLFLAKNIYKNWTLNVLEYWFLALLLLMSCSTLTKYARAVLLLVLSLSFASSLCIIVYHLFVSLGLDARVRKLIPLLKEPNIVFHRTNPIEPAKLENHKEDTDPKCHTVVSVSEVRRESLLDDEVYLSEDAKKKVNKL